MTDTEIIENLKSKLAVQVGRHLYGVLGTYKALDAFAVKLRQAKTPTGQYFPEPLSVNKGILEDIPDDEFHTLAKNEAKMPSPTAAHVGRAFDLFLRSKLAEQGLVVLSNLEMLFAYRVELNTLRTLAADNYQVVLLLPGKREYGRIVMFPDAVDGSYTIPSNLIAENHLWELTA
ncbi:MAG: hypothetical protein M1358_02135 [Chloroflexi bacterium]|nr:hypothetical protein [Chloroflexota bacterium]